MIKQISTFVAIASMLACCSISTAQMGGGYVDAGFGNAIANGGYTNDYGVGATSCYRPISNGDAASLWSGYCTEDCSYQGECNGACQAKMQSILGRSPFRSASYSQPVSYQPAAPMGGYGFYEDQAAMPSAMPMASDCGSCGGGSMMMSGGPVIGAPMMGGQCGGSGFSLGCGKRLRCGGGLFSRLRGHGGGLRARMGGLFNRGGGSCGCDNGCFGYPSSCGCGGNAGGGFFSRMFGGRSHGGGFLSRLRARKGGGCGLFARKSRSGGMFGHRTLLRGMGDGGACGCAGAYFDAPVGYEYGHGDMNLYSSGCSSCGDGGMMMDQGMMGGGMMDGGMMGGGMIGGAVGGATTDGATDHTADPILDAAEEAVQDAASGN